MLHSSNPGSANVHSANEDSATPPFLIALDGPAASGKSSVGLGAARALGFRYFDTGLLYRLLTWLALSQGIDPEDAASLTRLVDRGLLDDEVDVDEVGRVLRAGADVTAQLHAPAVDASVSAVSAHAGVREGMRPAQRALIRPPGLVMAGRDIGTVILPEAALKIWLNASVEERARRRSAQTGADYGAVLEGMRRRDQHDASREVAPMTRAPDAIEIQTDGIHPQAAIAQIVELARARGARSAPTQSATTQSAPNTTPPTPTITPLSRTTTRPPSPSSTKPSPTQ